MWIIYNSTKKRLYKYSRKELQICRWKSANINLIWILNWPSIFFPYRGFYEVRRGVKSKSYLLNGMDLIFQKPVKRELPSRAWKREPERSAARIILKQRITTATWIGLEGWNIWREISRFQNEFHGEEINIR